MIAMILILRSVGDLGFQFEKSNFDSLLKVTQSSRTGGQKQQT
jgi:hypothetical protein